jgi:lysophospholipase L1-like esterase
MYYSLRLLLICAALGMGAVFGQSLSIRNVNNQYSLEVSAAADKPLTLQATADFSLWIDVTNHLTGTFSSVLKSSNITSRFFRVVPSLPEPTAPIRIVALGDSRISDAMGWGGGIPHYLNQNATFVNYGEPGYGSTAAATWQMPTVALLKPQYVLFEFGGTDTAYNVSPEEFEANLRTIINGIRGFGGVPVAVTYQPLRAFDGAGNFLPWDFPYNAIVRKVASEMNTPLVDLDKIMSDLFRRLGPAGSEFMKYIHPDFPGDIAHVSPLGAVWVSQLALKSIPGLGPYLSENILDPPPNP